MPSKQDDFDAAALSALAHVHHAYFLGLQLMVATRQGPEVMGRWMFRLFRRQHTDKFLSSFEKLGLDGLPHAVACAQYHVISNSVGGVPVEYMYESDRKAWVRFRYPRWMYAGPTICGVPVEVSRGFLEGWYAHNGVSLGNPRLGFVCVSEDMTGEFGLCGYFLEYGRDLAEDERLVFAKDERPPRFDVAAQPAPPSAQWSRERLAKANRNYAVEYVRNGLCELKEVIGPDKAHELGTKAARLIGLQYYRETARMLGQADEDMRAYLTRMFRGMGDTVSDTLSVTGGHRIVRGLSRDERELVFACWRELWAGAVRSGRELHELKVESGEAGTRWRVLPEA